MFLLYNINMYLSMLLGIKFSHTPLHISHTPLNFSHIPYKKTRITPKTDALRVLNYSFESFRFSNQEIFERKLALFDLALEISRELCERFVLLSVHQTLTHISVRILWENRGFKAEVVEIYDEFAEKPRLSPKLSYKTGTLNTLYEILLAEEIQNDKRHNNHHTACILNYVVVNV